MLVERITEGLSLEALKDKACKIKAASKDYVVKQDDARSFLATGNVPRLAFDYDDEHKDMRINEFAFSQLCNKVGVPTSYALKCVEKKPELASQNINEWLAEYNQDLFVRTTDSRVRGILTTKYSPYDMDILMDDIIDTFDSSDFYLKQSLLNEERLHLRFISGTQLDIDGEDLYPGVTIDSSDVGRSNLMVNFFIWKQVCTNGLMVPQKYANLYRKKHMGITFMTFRRELREALDLVDPIMDTVKASIEKTIDEPIDFSVSTDDDMEDAVKRLKKMLAMNEGEVRRALTVLKGGAYEANRWGLINAITESAQDYTLERRVELEREAGKLLVA